MGRDRNTRLPGGGVGRGGTGTTAGRTWTSHRLLRRIYRALFPPHTRRALLLRKHLLVGPDQSPVGDADPRPWRTEEPDRRRVLVVLHDAPGGVAMTTRDLIDGLGDEFELFTLTSDAHRFRLEQVRPGGDSTPLGSWWLDRPWSVTRMTSSAAASAYRAVLATVRPDLVHLRHLLGHTADLVVLCKGAGVPYVVSVHDFFLVCPATQLLDEDRVFCGGACTPGVGRCLSVMPWLRDVGRFKGAVVERHRAGLAPHLEQAEAWITTSEWTREIVTAVYPGLRHRRWEVIEHGRDFPEQRVVRRPPRPDRPVGLVTIGHIGPHKGENELLELMRLDAGSGTRLRLTVLGTCGPRLRRYAEVTGPFDRGDLPALVERAAPSFSLLLSPWGETYSHALTESWSCGVPAIVPDIGALAARVRAHGGGWVLRDPSPERLLGEIERIARDADEYDRVSCEAHTRDLPSVADMGRSYARIFRDVLDAGR